MLREPVYIIDGVRTPFLKSRNKAGVFSAADLAVQAGRQLLLRQHMAPSACDEVIIGCAMPSVDEMNIARVIALRLSCGYSVTAWTVMRNCASGLQAIDAALGTIAMGRSQLVLVGGVDALSRSPLLFSDEMVAWFARFSAAKTMGQRLRVIAQCKLRYLSPVIGIVRGLTDPIIGLLMGQTAENIAYRFGITREEMDAFALSSHMRAHAAQEAGRFSAELVPLIDQQGGLYEYDDGLRPDSSAAALLKLRPMFDKPAGQVTAGNSSQVTDGAALLIVASQQALEKHRLSPLAKIIDIVWAGLDPAMMGLGPTYCSTVLLKRHGLSFGDIGLWEINEAFAAQVIGCLRAWQDDTFCRTELGLDGPLGTIDPSILNVDGGAVALGHPVGASGARITLHLAYAMKHRRVRYGIATICIGGGQGGAILLENVA